MACEVWIDEPEACAIACAVSALAFCAVCSDCNNLRRISFATAIARRVSALASSAAANSLWTSLLAFSCACESRHSEFLLAISAMYAACASKPCIIASTCLAATAFTAATSLLASDRVSDTMLPAEVSSLAARLMAAWASAFCALISFCTCCCKYASSCCASRSTAACVC